MEDNGNIIYYLILGAIYLLSRVLGKKKKKPGAVPQQKRKIAPPTAESEEPAMSFEDILRELSGARQPKPEPDPDPMPVPAFTPQPAPAIEPVWEEKYAVDEMDQIAVDYAVPKAIGSEYEQQPEIKRKKLTYERTEHFKIVERRTVDYLSLLGEEDGAAKAFVLSEIFARKY